MQASKVKGCAELPNVLLYVYRQLLACYGAQRWWPAQSSFEMMVGAVLTQNTAWRNVEMSIAALAAADLLSPQALLAQSGEQLQALIRSSGFFCRKSRCLQSLSRVIVGEFQGQPLQLLAGELATVRQRLLALTGIGPETADCILLYAGEHPIFVVDAYTRRIFERLGVLSGRESYSVVQHCFMDNLPNDVALFNEYHALIVRLAKDHCLSRHPRCGDCPLKGQCSFAAAA